MTDRVVLVTGAAQGLGAALARRFFAAGYRVALGDVRIDMARDVAAELSPDGSRALALELDVCSKAAFETARDAILAAWQRIDALVNNAGRSEVVPVMDVTAEQFDRAIDVNLRSVLFGCQVFGRYFAAHGGGRIVNIASLAGQNGGTATGAHYAASKAGVLNLTKVFARDLAAQGVTVNAISPGPMDLPIVHDSVPADLLDKLVAGIPAGRLGSADYVADVAVLLAAEHAWFTTGACWDVNGGLFMR
ncbi:SDR family NAD(P)-dependent oxidoreductase [Paraburkholderia caballeronis]|uniref:3-oxoacyl-[acyl-carrier protein] reductase n=1 Tax=Paraburkholderia caballeronis TaxID=416943 RepID=A0A1H7J7H9_9BURK|nr:SDR family oxidoreductase [Paraburkholderia caballeronis]PXW27529.1 3-oxoacyl-[acyl-carrier protein] reductase [Paraburkholderia caballeronis]PXX03003.1 3-oxoacyl-[acyl-carrier protein] reductase [Paraburkholderia caballeronis]RAK03728.1 3-oxoacyl-[acyl-carrier protein] reductase [Paraburkholderia caballeronis]SEC23112.1 3-oxoacyl-[acyl-carrier protein] reductase [Paraburkholderia caballeronis]SEK70689.1 3-oxoacyl-[acyl-carrier protein] reductase [Paraburkholderia caballeronis]